ncbi:MAG: MarR family transcriptional regulator [Acidimicrobiales bacterium]|nr:MarR family transcriptional regulator [Acidimicrobiales bacterium]
MDSDLVTRDPELANEQLLTDFGLFVDVMGFLTRVLNSELENECNLPLTWFEILLRLSKSPDRRASMGTMAETVALTTGGVTRLIDRIEEAELVKRSMCPSDRRVVWVSLTDRGLEKLNEATKVHLRGITEHFTGNLDIDTLENLRNAMAKILERKLACPDEKRLILYTNTT